MSAVADAIARGDLPGRVWLYSTYRCNLACAYCLTESSPDAAPRALDADRMVSLAREARALGFTGVGVTGGEPFLLRHMVDTLIRISEQLPAVVLTNGTLFGPRRLLELRALAGRDVAVQISLDSADPEAHDALRAPGNFAAVTASARALVDRGVRVRIATTGDLDDGARSRLAALVAELGVRPEDHVQRPVVARGRAVDEGLGVGVAYTDLPPELTLTTEGAFWSAFGPTVRGGRLDTDLLLTRTISPLSVPAAALLTLRGGVPDGADARLGIR